MKEAGFGYVADILVFALLISTAITILSGLAPVDLRVESERYASSFAQSLLISFQNATPEQLGGFEYRLGLASGMNIPLAGDSARRQLRHKTICQLLAECALLNLRAEVAGKGLSLLMPNSEMEDRLEELLKTALERAVAGRFGYRLLASVTSDGLGPVSLSFEMEVAELSGARDQLCSETVLVSLPGSRASEADLILELRLELWSL